MNKKNLPLTGTKIVELGQFMAAPMGTRILADWGAEVIKIEAPSGDGARFYGYEFNCPIDPQANPIFAHLNMNKKNVVLDLKKPESIAVVKELLSTADVFVTNNRMNALRKAGLDYDSLKEEFPELIYAYFSGYGSKGAESAKPGFDYTTFWSRSGLVDWVGTDDVVPFPSIAMGDNIAGSMIALSILAAIIGKKTTGKGIYTETSLLGVGLWSSSVCEIAAQPPNNMPLSRPDLLTAPNHCLVRPYKCKDGEWVHLLAGPLDRGGFKDSMYALELEEYLYEPRFNKAKEIKKPEHAKILYKIICDKFLERTSDEWCERFEALDFPHGRMVHFKDMCKDQQGFDNGYLKKMDFADGSQFIMPCIPVSFSAYDEPEAVIPGVLGADTRQSLLSCGYTNEQIDALVEQGILVVKD